jgi:hypothetical protein
MKPMKDPEEPSAPTACPFCHSPKITTASEKVDPSAYWRCEACGEMWNLARLQTSAPRHQYDRRWR